MLVGNPLLTLLGRRGRGAVVEALRRAPRRTWTVRDLARAADVPSAVASRAVRELAALGAVEAERPGRDARIRWRPESPAGAFLDRLKVPDLRSACARTFAAAYGKPPGVVTLVRYAAPGEDPADPRAPTRVAVVAGRDEAAARQAVAATLQALRGSRSAVPEVVVVAQADLAAGNSLTRAVQAGELLS